MRPSIDAFGNVTSRSTWDKDSNQRSYTATFTNNRKTSGGYGSGYDSFDVDGRVVYNEAGMLDRRSWKFDASGRMADWLETTEYVPNVRWDQGETLTFDGDGRTAKRLERRRLYASPPTGWYEEAEYGIFSSVTGQKIAELDNTGARKKTNIYMGSTVIAENTPGYGTVFKTADPVAGTVMQSELSGQYRRMISVAKRSNRSAPPFLHRNPKPAARRTTTEKARRSATPRKIVNSTVLPRIAAEC